MLKRYRKHFEDGLYRSHSPETLSKHYGKVPLSRYHTFEYCLDQMKSRPQPVVVELGTTRSYVDGRFEGCMSTDSKYWRPEKPEYWDWGAGGFTYLFSSALPKCQLHSVDISSAAIQVSKTITQTERHHVHHHLSDSRQFLRSLKPHSVDLLYLDTGDCDRRTAELHLEEAKIIVERQLLKPNGIILIDDVRNPSYVGSNGFGKAELSIPYFLDHGYKTIMDEYQVVLTRSDIKVFQR